MPFNEKYSGQMGMTVSFEAINALTVRSPKEGDVFCVLPPASLREQFPLVVLLLPSMAVLTLEEVSSSLLMFLLRQIWCPPLLPSLF